MQVLRYVLTICRIVIAIMRRSYSLTVIAVRCIIDNSIFATADTPSSTYKNHEADQL